MQFSVPCDLIATALVEIQAALVDPEKNRKVQAGPKAYSYAELDRCLPDIRALVTSKGVYIGQSIGDDIMVTTLLHKSGQWAQAGCPVTLPAKSGDPQAFGSSITYARRYGLFMALGLVAQNEDNDGKLTDSKDRGREAPDAKQARQDQHHKSWTLDVQKRFMGDLKKAGFSDYDEVCLFLEAQSMKRPSHMTPEMRGKVLERLKSPDGGEAYAKWLEAHVNDNQVDDGGGV